MTKVELDRAVQARLTQIQTALRNLDDTTALDCADAFPPWTPDSVPLVKDYRVTYADDLYRVEQSHTTQAGWEPPNVPALFTLIPKPGEIPVWRQPTGAQDAYMKGDKVYYPNKGDTIYISTVDNNVWAPGVYGWEVYEE